jgi:hypothetical protein
MQYSKQRSRESRAAIERLYITMRHLFIRGSYKPNGVSGIELKEALLTLKPEIYGDINDPERVDLEGLLYVAERLPRGIEECRFIQLVAREGFQEAGHIPFIPVKRRRNCYRVDKDRMYVEMSRGRSDLYDILTHITFLTIEAAKIMEHGLDHRGRETDTWLRLREVVEKMRDGEPVNEKRAVVYLSNVLGRTVVETQKAAQAFENSSCGTSLYHFAYWLGQVAMNEKKLSAKKEIFVSAKLRDVIGHHVYGEQWAADIKAEMIKRNWIKRPVHIISANLHSVMNTLYGMEALAEHEFKDMYELAAFTANDKKNNSNRLIKDFALENGMALVPDRSGTNLSVQLIDMERLVDCNLPFKFNVKDREEVPIILVMDYAFGEQAYECMDELLKPIEIDKKAIHLQVKSVAVMGKAGILEGKKGDLMIPTAHVFEGTADNYPLQNELSISDFEGSSLGVYEGSMITVLGTSLQNKDVLRHFLTSTWNAIGLEMEGAHYQKAIQSAARIRKSIAEDVKVLYAYYASDNPLVSGSTLSSGSLGAEGILPTYLITQKILQKILS